MNKDRRKQLRDAIAQLQIAAEALTAARDIIDNAHEDERAYFDAMPESIQSGEKGQNAETACDALSEAISRLDDLSIDDMISSIEDVL